MLFGGVFLFSQLFIIYKSIYKMKDIIKKLNESKQEEYRVELIGVYDEDHLPITISLLVEKDHIKSVEKWLKESEGKIFGRCDGGNVEY